MLYETLSEEKFVCEIVPDNKKYGKLYGVYSRKTHNCYLLTPEKSFAEKMIQQKSSDPLTLDRP